MTDTDGKRDSSQACTKKQLADIPLYLRKRKPDQCRYLTPRQPIAFPQFQGKSKPLISIKPASISDSE